MMVLVGGIIIALGFLFFVKLFTLVEKSTRVIHLAKSAVTIVRNSSLDDYQKEVAMQQHAKELLSLFFFISMGSIIALVVPLGLIWLMALAKLLTLNEVIETTLSLEFISATVILTVGYLLLTRKRRQ